MAAIHERLGGLDLPLALVWGMRDRVFQPVFLDQWRELFPAAPVTELEDAAHYLVEDRPDEVADGDRGVRLAGVAAGPAGGCFEALHVARRAPRPGGRGCRSPPGRSRRRTARSRGGPRSTVETTSGVGHAARLEEALTRGRRRAPRAESSICSVRKPPAMTPAVGASRQAAMSSATRAASAATALEQLPARWLAAELVQQLGEAARGPGPRPSVRASVSPSVCRQATEPGTSGTVVWRRPVRTPTPIGGEDTASTGS